MSVVEQADFVLMVYEAAHELGHSLGANHDGEGKAIACKASDGFIMSPKYIHDTYGTPFPKNRWTFSKCSLNSFKKTLKNKFALVRVTGLTGS
ncbi:hypothetical protein CHS0354_009879 [Potamilus streckersoni]|uniref:Peptidase M12B domain-containing protein n=1 Tax=Potamilus streckersoni TaxID=2493646 RepID=A0AAE0VPC1_9BIVA|nr:hypothetical protein CHS0354_009879 [Potamilus streckersoni]